MPPRVLPVSPKEILALLPPTPGDWKIISSIATNQVSSWLITIAQRQLEFTPAKSKNGPQGSASLPLMRTTFVLIDSGLDPFSAGAFANFKPARTADGEKLMLQGQPTIRTTPRPGTESLQMYINRRFVLQVQTENQPKDAILAWIQRVPFARYHIPATPFLSRLPSEVNVVSVDELNPANNHESKVAIGNHTGVGPR